MKDSSSCSKKISLYNNLFSCHRSENLQNLVNNNTHEVAYYLKLIHVSIIALVYRKDVNIHGAQRRDGLFLKINGRRPKLAERTKRKVRNVRKSTTLSICSAAQLYDRNSCRVTGLGSMSACQSRETSPRSILLSTGEKKSREREREKERDVTR